MLSSKHGQQVVEVLVTYGWMIILVVAIVVILFSLGIFSPLSFISPSSTISGFSGLKITGVLANYTYIEFSVSNSLSIDVNLNKFLLGYNNTFTSKIICEYLTLAPGQSSVCYSKLNLANTRDIVSLGLGFSINDNINLSSNGTLSFVPTKIFLVLPSTITEFTEEGLPSNILWWVVYKGINRSSTGTSITFSTDYGTYSYSVSNASVNGCNYTSLPSSGNLEAGRVGDIIFASSCEATFIEKGLPSSTIWQVDYAGKISSSTSNLIEFSNEKAGSYPFSVDKIVLDGCTYSPSPASGTLSFGSYQYIDFLGICTTTFTETGLPSGYTWDVIYHSLTESNSSPNSILYTGAPGNLSYSVSTLSNSSVACTTTYTPSPSSGYAKSGSAINIAFSPLTKCTNTFEESNLPSGYTWSVNYDGVTDSNATPNNIIIYTSQSNPGIYTYTAKASVNNLVCSSSASVQQGTTYDFSSWSCTNTFEESNLPSGYTWSVNYDGVTSSSTTPSDIIIHNNSGAHIYTAKASVNNLVCSSSASVQQGTTYDFSSWSCTTTFNELNLPSGFPWNVTYDSIPEYSTSTNMQFSTGAGSLPYSIPVLSTSSIEWNFGTSGYDGQIHQGMPTQPFPSAFSDLNNNGVECSSSPYNSQGYTAVAYMYFTSSITVTITTDDATAVFYAPAGTTSWSSVFGSNAWKGEGATLYTDTVSVTPGWYEVAVDWTNQCGAGMSAFEINGAYMTSNQFNVIGWTPSSDTTQLLPYSDLTANPANPSGITVEQTGSWDHQFSGYFTYTYTPPSSGSAYAGSTNSVSYSTSGSSTTEFYETGLPSGYTWSVSYDGQSGSASTGSPLDISLNSQSSQANYTASASVSDLSCTSSNSVEEGTTYTFTNWACTTTFTESGLPSGTTWYLDFNGDNQSSSSTTNIFTGGSATGLSYTAYAVYVLNVGNTGCSDLFKPSPSSGTANAGQSVPITYSPTILCEKLLISNSQSSATPNPFQQMINITSSDPAWSYINTNQNTAFGQNVEFFYSNGTVIPSWLEQYHSNYAIWWIKTGSIPASSSITVYIDFAPTGTNLFNTVNDGEAPQLSSTYAEYNDGNNVFNFYSDFAGTSLNTNKWSDSEDYVVDNGITLSPPSSSFYSLSSTQKFGNGSTLDFYGTVSNDTANGGGYDFGFGDCINCGTVSMLLGQPGTYGGYYRLYYYSSTSYDTTNYLQNTGIWTIGLLTNQNEVFSEFNYGDEYTLSSTTAQTAQSIDFTLHAAISGDTKITWVIIRATPPNSVMPSIAFESAKTPTVSPPTGITDYSPITITNFQYTATPSPFQQMINITSSDPAWSYINTNQNTAFGQNVEFFYSNGTVIPSWLEQYHSNYAIWWIKTGSLPSSSVSTFYMGFASTGTNLFNTVNDGEAPQLSSTYAEYDDGNNVFNFYSDFKGTSLNTSKWVNDVSDAGGTLYIDNGMRYTRSTTDSNYPFIYTKDEFYQGVFETYGTIPAGGETGAYTYASFGLEGPPFDNFALVGDFISKYGLSTQNSGNEITTGLSGGTYIWQIFVPASSSPTFISGSQNYGNLITNYEDMPSLPQPIDFIDQVNTGINLGPFYWVRVRSYPPNGVMPSVAIGSVQ